MGYGGASYDPHNGLYYDGSRRDEKQEKKKI